MLSYATYNTITHILFKVTLDLFILKNRKADTAITWYGDMSCAKMSSKCVNNTGHKQPERVTD